MKIGNRARDSGDGRRGDSISSPPGRRSTFWVAPVKQTEMAYRTGFWGLDGPLEGPIPIRRASSFNAGAPKADHLSVGAAENGKRDVGGLGWARPCLAFCHKCHIYDVMRSTKKLEG